MPISKHTKRLKQLEDLSKRGRKKQVEGLTCSAGHSVWQLQFVTDIQDLCQSCLQLRSQHEHPFGQRIPTFVIEPQPPAEPLPDLPAGYADPVTAAVDRRQSKPVDNGTGWSTRSDDPYGPMDEGVSMVKAPNKVYQPKLWR